MKRRWLLPLLGGIILGLALGYALATAIQSGSAPTARPASPDRVLVHLDVPAAVAWAGQGKWTVEPFPVETLNETEFRPLSPTTQGTLSGKSRRHVARCGQPLTADEQQTFFNRVTNRLSDALGKHAHPGGGGAVGQLPHGKMLVYCWHSDFHTAESSQLGTAGGVRGTATAVMVSDGASASLIVSLTEVVP